MLTGGAGGVLFWSFGIPVASSAAAAVIVVLRLSVVRAVAAAAVTVKELGLDRGDAADADRPPVAAAAAHDAVLRGGS